MSREPVAILCSDPNGARHLVHELELGIAMTAFHESPAGSQVHLKGDLNAAPLSSYTVITG